MSESVRNNFGNISAIDLERKFQKFQHDYDASENIRLQTHLCIKFLDNLDQSINESISTSFIYDFIPYFHRSIMLHDFMFESPSFIQKVFVEYKKIQEIYRERFNGDLDYSAATNKMILFLIRVNVYAANWEKVGNLILKLYPNLDRNWYSPTIETFVKTDRENCWSLLLNQLATMISEEDLRELSDLVSWWSGFASNKLKCPLNLSYSEINLGTIAEIRVEIEKSLSHDNPISCIIESHNIRNDDELKQQLKNIKNYLSSMSTNGIGFKLKYHFNTDMMDLSGDSCGIAMALVAESVLSLESNPTQLKEYYKDVVLTGRLNESGEIKAVNPKTIPAKLEATFFSPATTLLIPEDNSKDIEEALKVLEKENPRRRLDIKTVRHISEIHSARDITNIRRRTNSERLKQFSRKRKFHILGTLMSLMILLMTAVILDIFKDKQPFTANIEDGELKVRNMGGELLWIGQNKNHQSGNIAVVYDLDGDQKNEVLIAFGDQDAQKRNYNLLCYSADGNILWTKKIGESTWFGDNYYSDIYSVVSLWVEDLDGDSITELIGIASGPFFPTLVFVLDNQGNMIKSFWNSGNLMTTTPPIFRDMNDDGIKEIIIGGLNNEYGNATIIVLDYINMRGTSPQFEHYYTKRNGEPGSMMHYVRFPKNNLTEYSSPPIRDWVQSLISTDPDKFEVRISCDDQREYACNGVAIYTMDFDLNILMFDITDEYYFNYAKLYPDGPELKYNDPKVLKKFRNLEYWDGDNWSTKPTVNRHWRETKFSQ